MPEIQRLQTYIEEEIKKEKKKNELDLKDKKQFPTLDKKVVKEEENLIE
jgi:hypothetical protein